VNGVYFRNLNSMMNRHVNQHNVEWGVDAVLKFLEEQKGSKKPFFLYFATTYPHGPGPGGVKNGKYVNSLDADPGLSGEGYSECDYSFMPGRKTFKKKLNKLNCNEIAGPAAWWDSGVGAILKKLKDLGMEENTIIIYFSDHGRTPGKATVYERGVCVPLLVQWKKGQKKGDRVYSHVLGSVDFAPTILKACNVKVPKDMKMNGVSFLDVIKGSDKPFRKALLLEMGYAKAIRTDNWKYVAVRYPEDVEKQIKAGKKFKGFKDVELDQPYMIVDHPSISYHASQNHPHYFERDQLYDLKNDPEEKENVIKKYPEKAKELKKKMSFIMKEKFPHRPYGEFNK
jgi:hypothetical protein